AKIQAAQGDNYPAWVLDQLNLQTELANRVAMGPGLRPPRFRWVAFDDALLLPFDVSVLASENPDRKYFLGREKDILRQYLTAAHVNQLPATLAAYIAQVVMPTLEREKQQGAVAIKFEAAYLRPLNFQPPDMAAAASAYAKGGALDKADAYRLEDAIFHAIAVKAGELHLPVHFHTGFGCGSYFDLRGANPLLLDGVLNDPSLRGTTFVLLHGGAGPYSKAVAGLLSKPNVYTDFSEQTWLLPTFQVAKMLRYWLEYYPDKIMFGTDASPGTPDIDWPEYAFQANASGRRALAMALTGMLRDHEITRARALEIAHAVMRGTALHLYGWPEP
ncbi:MAG: amidohydrolase family protein, partial [Terriglobales bacterium]